MAQKLDPEDWPSIVFEGCTMSQSLKGISILVSADGVPERAGDWIWRLCHCHGIEKRGEPDWVADSAQAIIDYMLEQRIAVLSEIEERLSPHGFSQEPTFAEWMSSLSDIRDIAASKTDECSWIAGAPLSPSERKRLADNLLKGLDDHEA